MANSTIGTTARAIGWSTLGFGLLGTVAPGALRTMYGDSASSGGALNYFERTWGTRNAVLGALTLMATSDAELKRISTLGAAMSAVDSIVAFRSEGLPGTTRSMAGLTSAGFAAASTYVAMNL